jgi:hypothetical protein
MPQATRLAPSSPCARAIHQLRTGCRVADKDEGIGALFLEPRQLRGHVDVGVLELLDAGDLESGVVLVGIDQALLIGRSPRVVDQHQPRLLGAELLAGVVEQLDVDQNVDGRDAKHEIGIGAVAGDAGAGGPDGHVAASPC